MPLLLRSLILLSTLFLIGAIVAPSTFSTVPLLVWSGDEYFPVGSHNPELISNEQLETLFQRITGLKAQDTAIEFVKSTPPEVVVVFVANKLRTDQFSQYAQRQGLKEHQVFNRLRTAYKTSKSSASCPYVLASEYLPLSDVISQTANDLLQSSPSSSVYFVNEQSETATEKSQSGVTSRTPLQFLEEISLGNPIFSNGVTDFVAVYFSPKEENSLAKSLSEDDSYIGTVHQIINKETKGNYIAVFTADTPQEKSVRRIRAAEKEEEQDVELTTTISNFFQKYFPLQLTLALASSALLILILLVGVICTMDMQTPQRFETPRVRRVEN